MAFYAEMKRRRWYKVVELNMIYLYKKKLYDDWYNSLTDEQKERLAERRRQRELKAEREFESAINNLFYLASKCVRPNTYGGVYDELGFPKL